MSWDDDFLKKANFSQFDLLDFDRVREDSDEQRESSQRVEYDDRFEEANKTFYTTQIIFFVFFGIVLTLTVTSIVVKIFLICYRQINGHDFPLCRGNIRSTTTTTRSVPTAAPTSCNVLHCFHLNFIYFCALLRYSISRESNSQRIELRFGIS